MKKQENNNNHVLHIYSRVSSQHQFEKGNSLDEQVEMGKRRAEELGMEYEIHNEGGASASHEDFTNRPVLFNLLQLVDKGTASNIFVFDVTRLSRRDETKQYIFHRFKKKKINLYTAGSKIDFNNAIDNLTFGILTQIEAYESYLRKDRFAMGIRNAQMKGIYCASFPPYGYKKENKRLVIDEEESKVFLLMVDMYLNQGVGSRSIARYLNDNGIKPRAATTYAKGLNYNAGKSNRKDSKLKTEHIWNKAVIMRMLRNEKYAGIKKIKTGVDSEGVATYETIQMPAIISKEIFDKIQQVKDKNRMKKRNEPVNFYLLSGLLQCDCGAGMFGVVNSKKHSYGCNSKKHGTNCGNQGIGIMKLNEIVFNLYKQSYYYVNEVFRLIKDQFDSGDSLQEAVLEVEKDLRKKQQEEKNNAAKIKELVKKSLDGRTPIDIYNELMDELNVESKRISNDIQVIEASLNVLKRQQSEEEQTKNYFMTDMETITRNAIERLGDFSGIFDTDLHTNIPLKETARRLLKQAIRVVKVKWDKENLKHIINVEFHPMPMKTVINDEFLPMMKPADNTLQEFHPKVFKPVEYSNRIDYSTECIKAEVSRKGVAKVQQHTDFLKNSNTVHQKQILKPLPAQVSSLPSLKVLSPKVQFLQERYKLQIGYEVRGSKKEGKVYEAVIS